MLRVACDNVEMLEEIILVFIGRVDRYAIDVDNALGIVDGMSRKSARTFSEKSVSLYFSVRWSAFGLKLRTFTVTLKSGTCCRVATCPLISMFHEGR